MTRTNFNWNYVYAAGGVAAAVATNVGSRILWNGATTTAKVFGEMCPQDSLWWSVEFSSTACQELSQSFEGQFGGGVALTMLFGAVATPLCLWIWNTRPIQQINSSEIQKLIINEDRNL